MQVRSVYASVGQLRKGEACYDVFGHPMPV
jgi:hypothetical protein